MTMTAITIVRSLLREKWKIGLRGATTNAWGVVGDITSYNNEHKRWHGSDAIKTIPTSNDDVDSDNDKDIQTNGGMIEGVWIFVRHGDRAPSQPLSPSHKIPTEADFWRSKLPRPDTWDAFEEFSHYYPPAIHPGTNNGEFLDAKRAPFGFLTHTGVKQTNELGLRLFRRYNNHGFIQRQNDDGDNETISSTLSVLNYRTAHDFLTAWDVKAYSTNYIRTIMSAQSLLDGLFGTKCYTSLAERIRRTHGARALHDEYFMKELRIPNHNSVINYLQDEDADPTGNSSNEVLVPVQVRGPEEDTLNAFDRSPELMAELVSCVICSQEFQEGDGAAAPLAARLANILPGLARKKKNTTGFNAAPSGINWIEASDHFVCRKAHSVPYARFSDFEHDEQYESTLTAMSHQTTTHLAWRFRQWYKNPVLLANIAAPGKCDMEEMFHLSLFVMSPYLSLSLPLLLFSCSTSGSLRPTVGSYTVGNERKAPLYYLRMSRYHHIGSALWHFS
jgi:Histidine phosphatase superfamily (branch 2)